MMTSTSGRECPYLVITGSPGNPGVIPSSYAETQPARKEWRRWEARNFTDFSFFTPKTMVERNKKALLDLLNKDGNSECADCGCGDPDWASANIGIFICIDCAGIHRMLGAHISKVKSLRLDSWSDDQVEFMTSTGNLAAKAKYEIHVPPFYHRPMAKDPQVLREQWIRAKYERMEFQYLERQTYLSGYKEGFLWKRGKENSTFQQRRFILAEEDDILKYYQKADAKEPKAAIKISELNANFTPEKIGNPNGLQISWVKDGSTRNIYVYTEDGKDIVDWYTSVRAAKYNRLKVAYPGGNDADLVTRLTRTFVKEGWLYKTGPRHNEPYKRRWFTLDDRRLMYFEDPLDAYPKGEIFLGHKSDGYKALEGVPPGKQDVGNSFTIRTPGRDYLLGAETEEERVEWMDVLRKVFDRPISPQDSTGRRKTSWKS
ncbi:ADAP1 [Branchiostoma lanceolatum]|uniref:ADAP1 protein n=1 Tax=Branchiostoma lanceolatum TaxID=7740 RepID=A0A8K0F3G7_BRALA|nr:ADAP1 [Branchiostoma lanceolatum]